MTDATTGVTLTTPQPVTPTANQQLKYAEQPLTLTVKNAAHTGSVALTYTFEVATDAAFASKVYTKDGVAEGAAQTAQQIDKLADSSATDEERQARKRRLLKGPKEFRDIRRDRPKPKR